MMAAITAGRAGATVVLIEHKDRVGKKILSTGNGRCNFTNLVQKQECYRSDNSDFPWGIIGQFTAQDTIAFFLKLGIYSKNKNGYLYPNSEQAAAVLDVLRMEIERLETIVYTNTNVKSINVKKSSFQIITENQKIDCDSLILATGSKAASVTGSDGSGYDLAKWFGHRIVPVLPALVQLQCAEKFYKNLAGIRVQGKVSLYVDEKLLSEDIGELQMTKYGISGIPVFQVSRYAARGLYHKQNVYAVLNFMPDFTEEQMVKFLKKRVEMQVEKTLETFFIGLFHKKLSDTLISLSGISRTSKVSKLTEMEIRVFAGLIQNFKTTVTATNGFEQAQICTGGVSTEELDSHTLESKLIKGLYFAGELIDVDGICGGYNLQWAWSSGHITGREAARC